MTMALDRRQVVTFALGDDLFAADVTEVERVLAYRPLATLPNLPDWVAGMAEYGGRSLPVLDLRARFSMPAAPTEVARRVLVLDAGGVRVGLIVDRVVDVVAVPPESWDVAPPLFRGLSGEYLHGVLRRDGRLVMVLDAARLLSSTERLALERVAV